jgi:hypothetical protein
MRQLNFEIQQVSLLIAIDAKRKTMIPNVLRKIFCFIKRDLKIYELNIGF